ncbi:TrkA family potassium uptake protein [Natronomonas sp. LN261]|uniref:potassium channel family protein n=1 Tax=Natronomonas sp. LN261 TaxID=2750669 RepID=UPI0021039632|nr:NAD-binding protein [Natronomonas sp. LN261]
MGRSLAELGRWIAPSRVTSAWSQLALWQRRALNTILAVTALLLASSVLYHYVMITFEGRSPTYSHSLQVVIETYTGTGYGSDAPWESSIANTFVSIMDLSTFLVLFIVVPYVFRPVLESALSPVVPTSIDRSDHVIVCGIAQQGTRLIEEFESQDVDYVVVAETEDETIDLMEADVPVIYGDPTSAETHRQACIDDARAVVIDTEDSQSVSALLAIRAIDETVRTVVLVDNLERERHLRYAGADRVLTPRHLLGRRIAERISTEITPTRSDSVRLGEDLSIVELTVFEESPIHGESLGEIEATAGQTVTVIGLWKDGRFLESPPGETTVDEDTVLLAAGREQEVRRLETETYRGREIEPTVVIAGDGVVGSTVRQGLERSTADCLVVDIEAGENVTVVGDVTEEGTLERVSIDESTVFVVTISDDDEAILSTLLANELAADTDIIVRLNHDTNEMKARRAGADYVLSLPEMSGRVLAQEVLHEDVLSYSRQLKAIRIDAEPFAGRALGETDLGESDCAVVAVERGGALITDVASNFGIRDGDRILVVGSDEDIDALTS